MSTNQEPMVLSELLRRWRAQGVPVEEARTAVERRERVVSAIGRAVRNAPRRQRRVRLERVVLGGLAAAAALAIGVASWQLLASSTSEAAAVNEAVPAAGAGVSAVQIATVAGTVVAHTASGARVLVAGEPVALEAGDEVSTGPDGRVRLGLEASTEVVLSPASRLRLVRLAPLDQRLSLPAGRIDVALSDRHDNQKLVVVTPDAEVHVVGTIFSVEVDAAGRTGVDVTRGKVRILRRGAIVASIVAGEQWTSKPAAPAEECDATPDRGPEPAASRPAPEPPVAGEVGRSELAAQNQLYRVALDARNAGDDGRALRLLDQFLSRYPSSPLAQEAQVERFRALRRLGRGGEAAREARHYLAEHESGFARDEARELILAPEGKSEPAATP